MIGEVVLACDELEPDLTFFVDRLGFELALISPADDPEEAVVVGHGLRLRLDARAGDRSSPGTGPPSPVRLRLTCDTATAARLGPELRAPGGTTIEVLAADRQLDLPPVEPRFELSRFDAATFGTGRASMAYRDLLPARQGGRFIASHIRIADAGPVPDYVHHHRIRFQMIYCLRGWVRVVYEDQGLPFVMEPGDCVLQPPGIRHRVLESSDGLEVVELGCPARHDTLADRRTQLPTGRLRPERVFEGQRFLRHIAAEATWSADPSGATVGDLGMADATGGLASARVVRSAGREPSPELFADGDHELLFVFLIAGTAHLATPEAAVTTVGPADAVALPRSDRYRLGRWSPDFEALEVRLPPRPLPRPHGNE
ncbi:MAG: cupin domain-containing protein [Acidimicrobiia bacterium]|nr:cupin domain-containing protein [Acidimicrobiia bacterium]